MMYAGFWRRVAASLLDGAIIYIAQALIHALLGVKISYSTVDGIPVPTIEGYYELANALSTLVSVLYFTLMESSPKQATLGKQALGIYVTDMNGNRISFARALGRYFAKILSVITLLIGFIIAAFTEKKQALHDIVANTLVLKRD